MKNFVFYLSIATFLLLPFGSADAAKLSIGSPCTSNDQCQSNDCETSSKEDSQGNNLAFCDCGELDTSVINPSDSQDCADAYGGSNNDWTCADGANLTWDLDYCKKNNNIYETQFPIPPKEETASVIDMLLDPTAVTVQMYKEIDNIVATPQPKISIPGLKFSEPKTVEEPSGKYLYIPFLGDYISSIYKYLIIVAGIIATAMIIKAGFDWLMSGGESEKITHAKTRIGQSLMGLFIAVSSYFILNLINPNLVEFKNLRVRFVEPKPLQYEFGGDTETHLEATTQDAQKLTFFCPGNGGSAQIPAIIDSMKGKVAYRFGGKGKGSPPYDFSEFKPEFMKYDDNCPDGNACLDCSGFINYVYKCAGIPEIHGGTKTMFSNSETIEKIDWENYSVNDKPLKAGDLLGWVAGEGGKEIGHVIMYIGNGKMAESKGGESGRQPGANPRIEPFIKYKKHPFKHIRRLTE